MTSVAILPIITGEGAPVLRRKTAKVSKVTKDIRNLISSMQDTVKNAEGLGLAAPQIGQSLRLCLATINGKMTPLINPEILWRSDEVETMAEGCLSLPGKEVSVTRPVAIILHYLDEKNQEQERRLFNLDARVVQHEVDHLEGVLIVDYLQEPGLVQAAQIVL